MNPARFPHRQQGVSLIEVLVAVLIFSLGMIGLAGLLVLATRANHGAYVRTQVAYMAHNMADRMSANPIGVWQGNYDSDAYPLDTGGTDNCNSSCSPTELAAYDQAVWSRQLTNFLPNPKANIKCTAGSAGYAPDTTQINMRPPYGGNCTMTISWSEQPVGGPDDRNTSVQTFAWEFQP